MKSSVIEQKI